MSVHGEYARALAGVLERLADCDSRLRDAFRPALDAARVTPERDLSTAARSALAVLDRMEATLEAQASEPEGGGCPPRTTADVLPADDVEASEPEMRLHEACQHLRAHVTAILGTRRTGP